MQNMQLSPKDAICFGCKTKILLVVICGFKTLPIDKKWKVFGDNKKIFLSVPLECMPKTISFVPGAVAQSVACPL